MKIYTITLNPAYDVHAFTEEFAPFHENLATITSRQAGGKGVNISRALCLNGVDNTAVVVVGKENNAEFKAELDALGIDARYLEKPGRIRENLTLHCKAQPETRISFSGFPVNDALLDEVAAFLEVDAETVITFTGRVASGMSMEKVKTFLVQLNEKGAKIVLDSKSFTKEDIAQVQPWLIKPNQEEIAQYCESAVQTLEDAAQKAAVFSQMGVDNVMVSLGEQGAMLLTGGKVFAAKPPAITAVSTIGAGDSAIAGFLAAAKAGEGPANCLKMAVAYGSAACLTEGTLPPEKKDISHILEQVQLQSI